MAIKVNKLVIIYPTLLNCVYMIIILMGKAQKMFIALNIITYIHFFLIVSQFNHNLHINISSTKL